MGYLSPPFLLFALLLGAALHAHAQQCGRDAGGALCTGGLCCSKWGYCGSTIDYCGEGCQSQCPGGGGGEGGGGSGGGGSGGGGSGGGGEGGNLTSIISEATFNEMLLHRDNVACPARGFYTYSAFIAAAEFFPAFGNTGDDDTRKREIAAFLAQTSHETTGGWPTAPDGPYAWGYCFVQEIGNPPDYCVASTQWPCVPGKKYFGRGPIQLSYNYNYGPAGQALGHNLLSDPDSVAADPIISFETALWFWMTPQPPKPSAHDVIIGRWTPSPIDVTAGRLPGYGVITNIINGGLECGHGTDARVTDRIGFYLRYCDLLGVDPGDNLDCGGQTPFG
ncbi:unnamed protein product [Victoria cruziana]